MFNFNDNYLNSYLQPNFASVALGIVLAVACFFFILLPRQMRLDRETDRQQQIEENIQLMSLIVQAEAQRASESRNDIREFQGRLEEIQENLRRAERSETRTIARAARLAEELAASSSSNSSKNKASKTTPRNPRG